VQRKPPTFKPIPGTWKRKYPEIYGPWSTMSQALMNGPSPLSQGERELILAYAAAAAGCEFVGVAHAEVAYAWGIARGSVEHLVADPATAQLEPRLKALLGFVRKLAVTPAEVTQADADAVFQAGWDEQALHDAVAITARAAFMQRLVQGFGFTPLRAKWLPSTRRNAWSAATSISTRRSANRSSCPALQ
jgi:uncharacterized peroxidase-related enzyme